MNYKDFLEELGYIGITYKTVPTEKSILPPNCFLQFSYKDNRLGAEYIDTTEDCEDSFRRIFKEYSKVISPQEIDLCSLSQELFVKIYTLQEYIDNLNEREKLIAPIKNIDNYFVIEEEVYTKEELLQMRLENTIDCCW